MDVILILLIFVALLCLIKILYILSQCSGKTKRESIRIAILCLDIMASDSSYLGYGFLFSLILFKALELLNVNMLFVAIGFAPLLIGFAFLIKGFIHKIFAKELSGPLTKLEEQYLTLNNWWVNKDTKYIIEGSNKYIKRGIIIGIFGVISIILSFVLKLK